MEAHSQTNPLQQPVAATEKQQLDVFTSIAADLNNGVVVQRSDPSVVLVINEGTSHTVGDRSIARTTTGLESVPRDG